MFSVGEDVEADALFKRGWTVSAIARHLERDRKTVRSYLTGERAPGVRRPAWPDALGRLPRVPRRPVRRRPTSVGFGSLRRGRPSWLQRLVCELRPSDPPGGPAPALRGVLGGKGSRDDRDRSPRGRRDPMGLVREAARPVGRDGLCALGHPVALGPHPWGAVGVDGPGAPRRGDGRRACDASAGPPASGAPIAWRR